MTSRSEKMVTMTAEHNIMYMPFLILTAFADHESPATINTTYETCQ